jgi:hypothetical protein
LPTPKFPDLGALNAWLEQRCLELWREIPHGVLPGTIADVWAEEQAALVALPAAFDGFVEKSKRVSPKPGALRNGAPFAELPKAFRQLQDHMLRRPGGDREMVDILALVLHHDEQAVLAAVELALEAGVPTKTHVLTLLHRLIDGKIIDGPPLDTPQALILKHEPKANVARYNGLRAQLAGDRHAS